MNRTKIDWPQVDEIDRPLYTWNPVTGCWGPSGTADRPMRCSYCYAQRMAARLKGRFGYPADDPFRPAIHPKKLAAPGRVKSPGRVFVCSMGDLFGSWNSNAVVEFRERKAA